MALIKPSTTNTQTYGPCIVNWNLCSDQNCLTASTVDSNDMKIELNSRSLIVNPTNLYTSEIVYLQCH